MATVEQAHEAIRNAIRHGYRITQGQPEEEIISRIMVELFWPERVWALKVIAEEIDRLIDSEHKQAKP